MADVEMKEASGSAGKGKAVVKGSEGAAADGKKKFEVKKVQWSTLGTSPRKLQIARLTTEIVECCCPLGLGHCR